MWVVHASLLRGISWAISGNGTERIKAIIRGLDDAETIGSEQSRANQLSWLAEAQGQEGQPEKGLETVEQALAHVEKSGERLGEADISTV